MTPLRCDNPTALGRPCGVRWVGDGCIACPAARFARLRNAFRLGLEAADRGYKRSGQRILTVAIDALPAGYIPTYHASRRLLAQFHQRMMRGAAPGAAEYLWVWRAVRNQPELRFFVVFRTSGPFAPHRVDGYDVRAWKSGDVLNLSPYLERVLRDCVSPAMREAGEKALQARRMWLDDLHASTIVRLHGRTRSWSPWGVDAQRATPLPLQADGQLELTT